MKTAKCYSEAAGQNSERQGAMEDMNKKRQEEHKSADETRKQLQAEKKVMENFDGQPSLPELRRQALELRHNCRKGLQLECI